MARNRQTRRKIVFYPLADSAIIARDAVEENLLQINGCVGNGWTENIRPAKFHGSECLAGCNFR